MSTQFRSRIKSAVTYAQENGATGACCLPDGYKLSGDDVTFYTCNQQNGFFRQGDPDLLQCPDRGLTGCCCACSNIRDQYGSFDDFLRADFDNVFSENTPYYGNASALGDNVNTLGLKDNVTQCECFNRRGKWFYGKCNEIGQIQSLCGHYNNIITNKELYDVRFPAACCHGSSGDPGSLECTEVCTEKECSDLAVGGEELPFSLYNGIQSGGDGLLCEPAGSLNDPPVPPFDTNINCSVDAVQGFERQAQTQGDLLTDIQLKIK